MGEPASPEPDGPLHVSWDEARELVAVMLLAAAVMVAAAPGVIFIGTGGPFGFWDDVAQILSGINTTVGLLLIASAVLVCTVPPVDMVPLLRRSVLLVSVVVAALGAIALVIELTSPSARTSQAVWIRLGLVLRRSAPATLLAGASAWLARRVVPFPQ